MKIINEQIEVMVMFDRYGNIIPWKFRVVESEDEYGCYTEFICNNPEEVRREEIDGQTIITYACESTCVKKIMHYELQFNVATFKWIIYRTDKDWRVAEDWR